MMDTKDYLRQAELAAARAEGRRSGMLEAAKMAEEEANKWRSKAGTARHAIAASLDSLAARLRAKAEGKE